MLLILRITYLLSLSFQLLPLILITNINSLSPRGRAKHIWNKYFVLISSNHFFFHFLWNCTGMDSNDCELLLVQVMAWCQIITLANDNKELCRYLTSIGYSELTDILMYHYFVHSLICCAISILEAAETILLIGLALNISSGVASHREIRVWLKAQGWGVIALLQHSISTTKLEDRTGFNLNNEVHLCCTVSITSIFMLFWQLCHCCVGSCQN